MALPKPINPADRMRSAIIRSTLAVMEMSIHDLALKVGKNPTYVQRICDGKHTCERTRRRVELALELSVWSGASKFSTLAAVTALAGVDPILGDIEELRSAAARLGLPIKSTTPREAILSLLKGLLKTQSDTHPADHPHERK